MDSTRDRLRQKPPKGRRGWPLERRLVIVLGFIAVAVIVLPLAYLVVAVSALRSDCSVDHLQTGLSPDGRYAYSTFWKDCGATAKWFQGVALRQVDDPFADDEAHTVLLVDGTDPIQVTWTDAHSVEIAVSPFARAFPQLDKWQDLNISVVHREKF